MQQQLEILEINKNAIELVAMIEFLYGTKIDDLVDHCFGKSDKFIYGFVFKYRKKRLKETRYESFEHFKDTYSKNPVAALERLFQEHIGQDRYKGLRCNDPFTIYGKHIIDPAIRFDRFSMQFK